MLPSNDFSINMLINSIIKKMLRTLKTENQGNAELKFPSSS